MSVLTEAKGIITTGTTLDLTNHYVPEGHACFGTRRVTIAKTNSSSFYLEGSPWPLRWPKAAQVRLTDSGAVQMFGQGAGQAPGDLSMTFTPIAHQ